MRRLGLLFLLCLPLCAFAVTYEVGPSETYTSIGAVPWESLGAGDTVRIHYRSNPYKEKWVICRQGLPGSPIVVQGVLGPNGELPIIEGNDATTRTALNYWNQERGIIKIGGANTPPDTTPQYIVIENLDIRSGRPPFSFTAFNGNSMDYINNAASIYVEKAKHLIIRNCILHDSGNGLFIGAFDGLTEDVLVESNYIYDNGNSASAFEHNNYTAAHGIVFQYNHFGPLRAGCLGNNLKDRSAGTVIRYNWIDGGNRALDLVDDDGGGVSQFPEYSTTYVYGNVLIEEDDNLNSQIAHYGGDSGNTNEYRKGTLYFYNNTIVSYRPGNTTLLRLSTNDETADVRNNIVYVTATGDRLALIDGAGTFNYRNDWFKTGYVESHSGVTGTINDQGGNLTGSSPGFLNELIEDFHLALGSASINMGTVLAPTAPPVDHQYVKHQQGEPRPLNGVFDMGAFEFVDAGGSCLFCDEFDDSVLDPNWTYVKGTWSENGSELVGTFNKKADAIATPVFAGCSICAIDSIIRTGLEPGVRLSLLGWYIDKKNYVELMVMPAKDKLILKQRTSGASTKAKASMPIDPDTPYDIQLAFNGTNFSVALNGNTVLTLPSIAPANGSVGFRVKNGTGRFDRVEVN